MNPASFESPPRKKGRSNPVIVFRLPFFCPLILLCFLVIFLEKFFLPFVESRRVVWGASGLGGHRPFQKEFLLMAKSRPPQFMPSREMQLHRPALLRRARSSRAALEGCCAR